MFDVTETTNIIMLLIPVILIVYSLVAFCVVKILKEGTSNLNKFGWIAIVVVGNLLGSISFLLFGRRRDNL